MKTYLSGIERRILAVLQQGFPDSQSPYQDMAQEIGIETKQLLSILRKWKQQGKLRRVGVIVNHFKVGLSAGAMVVWQVEPERIEQVGQILAGFREVSHAYERKPSENWPYNLYSMVHGKNVKDVEQVVRHISRKCGIAEYRVLFTEKELKKVPPTYITQDSEQSIKEE